MSAAVLLQVDEIINIIEREGRAPIEIPEIDRADAGKAQTLMILGSDRRYGDKEAGLKPRSDTIILVRLDPDKEVIAMTSIPRDLLVDIPGVGTQVEDQRGVRDRRRARDRADGQARCSRRRRATFPINHVITVDFGGFRQVIDYIGCVYADIDRDYFNDVGGPGGYAVIDIDPGYQKLCGTRRARPTCATATATTTSSARARQQDFLRQVRSQKGIRKLLEDGYAPSNLKKLARIFARYFDSDKGLRQKQELFRFAKTVLFTAQNPVREVRFRRRRRARQRQPRRLAAQLEETVDEFLEREGSATPREPTEPTAADVEASQASAPSARRTSRRRSRASRRRAPRARTRRSSPRARSTSRSSSRRCARAAPPTRARSRATYTIRDEQRGKHDAYRLVLAKGIVGEYYGVQGTTWRQPPILDDPHDDDRPQRPQARWSTATASASGSSPGARGRPSTGSSNTLTQSLSGQQMIGIAASLRRLGGG